MQIGLVPRRRKPVASPPTGAGAKSPTEGRVSVTTDRGISRSDQPSNATPPISRSLAATTTVYLPVSQAKVGVDSRSMEVAR